MFCQKCGTEITDDSQKFCHKCGERLSFAGDDGNWQQEGGQKRRSGGVTSRLIQISSTRWISPSTTSSSFAKHSA